MRFMFLLALLACDRPPQPAGHVHAAPHGGTLIELGSHFAHVELVFDSSSGALTGYVLDGEAEKSIRIEQKTLELRISDFTLELAAVENTLTGETVGDTSEFAGRSDRLKGLAAFKGALTSVTVKGQTFRNVEFGYPEGNE